MWKQHEENPVQTSDTDKKKEEKKKEEKGGKIRGIWSGFKGAVVFVCAALFLVWAFSALVVIANAIFGIYKLPEEHVAEVRDIARKVRESFEDTQKGSNPRFTYRPDTQRLKVGRQEADQLAAWFPTIGCKRYNLVVGSRRSQSNGFSNDSMELVWCDRSRDAVDLGREQGKMLQDHDAGIASLNINPRNTGAYSLTIALIEDGANQAGRLARIRTSFAIADEQGHEHPCLINQAGKFPWGNLLPGCVVYVGVYDKTGVSMPEEKLWGRTSPLEIMIGEKKYGPEAIFAGNPSILRLAPSLAAEGELFTILSTPGAQTVPFLVAVTVVIGE